MAQIQKLETSVALNAKAFFLDHLLVVVTAQFPNGRNGEAESGAGTESSSSHSLILLVIPPFTAKLIE